MRSAVAVAAIAAAGFFTAAAGRADDPAVDCRHQGDTTYEMNVCAGRDFTAADAAMNVLYKKLYAAYDAGNKKRLQEAQRAWLKLRDTECDYETALTIGGTIHSTMVTMCDTELTLERVKRLKAQASCEEGDMSCNHP